MERDGRGRDWRFKERDGKGDPHFNERQKKLKGDFSFEGKDGRQGIKEEGDDILS